MTVKLVAEVDVTVRKTARDHRHGDGDGVAHSAEIDTVDVSLTAQIDDSDELLEYLNKTNRKIGRDMWERADIDELAEYELLNCNDVEVTCGYGRKVWRRHAEEVAERNDTDELAVLWVWHNSSRVDGMGGAFKDAISESANVDIPSHISTSFE